jgi:type IV fimbrial biogenesis protein FimT
MNTSTSSSNLIRSGVSFCGRPRTRSRGFSLIEALAVMTIAAILIGVGTPAMTATLRSVELTSATNDFIGSLLLARSEAVKRKGRVVLCKSPDGATCAQAGDWDQGWIVFHDVNNNAVHDPGEAIIQRTQALRSDLRVTGNASVTRYVSYAASGTTNLSNGGFQAGTITVCGLAAGEARQIVLSSSGRPRVQKATVASCA